MRPQKEITIYDLAEKLKISAATVSRALKNEPGVNTKTRKKIIDLAEKLGYRCNQFASNLRSKRSYTVGVILQNLKCGSVVDILAGIEMVNVTAGYDLLLASSAGMREKELAHVQRLFHRRVDGLIVSSVFDTNALDHFQVFTKKGIPVVLLDRDDKSGFHTAIIADYYKSTYQAMIHLIQQGCKRIVLLSTRASVHVHAARSKAYRDALIANGMTIDECLLMTGDITEHAIIHAAEKIAGMKPLPDGAFITHDMAASICIHTWKASGIVVPDQIAVVGYNNDPIASLMDPPLTTINYPGEAIGTLAATSLLDHLMGKSILVNTIIVKTNLVIRRSSLKKTD